MVGTLLAEVHLRHRRPEAARAPPPPGAVIDPVDADLLLRAGDLPRRGRVTTSRRSRGRGPSAPAPGDLHRAGARFVGSGGSVCARTLASAVRDARGRSEAAR